jgi:hypothetical protein
VSFSLGLGSNVQQISLLQANELVQETAIKLQKELERRKMEKVVVVSESRSVLNKLRWK